MALTDPHKAYWTPEGKGLELLDWTLGDLLHDAARRRPDKEAVVYSVYPELGLDVRWTYSVLDRRVDEVARGLLAMGIGKGDKVAVWSSNVPEWILLMFATARIGAVLVTVNTNSTPRELAYVLKQSDSRALFLMPKYRSMDYVERFETLVFRCQESGGSAPSKAKTTDVIATLSLHLSISRPSPTFLVTEVTSYNRI